ncbi:hypothetical protein IAQ61_003179 [Plenodomus lingam]|uniref:uncharacterized protein n=1 Tax=Leptosphaeria maculans TaxID=5022 RepID=UPI00331D9C68|nr:hypothetical protein IAQ61_003179 [Plenodomus lingam]
MVATVVPKDRIDLSNASNATNKVQLGWQFCPRNIGDPTLLFEVEDHGISAQSVLNAMEYNQRHKATAPIITHTTRQKF